MKRKVISSLIDGINEIKHQALITKEVKMRFSTLTEKDQNQYYLMDIFDKLYYLASTKNEKSKLRDYVQREKELAGCTFHPQLIAKHSPRKEKSAEIYPRLSRLCQKERKDSLKEIKTVPEMKNCTFKSELRNSNSNLIFNKNVYDRLSLQGEISKQAKAMKSKLGKEREIDKCTFAPKTRWRQTHFMIFNTNEKTHDRLYKEYDHKKSKEKKMREEFQKAELNECSFKPVISSSIKRDVSNKSIYKRLYAEFAEKEELMKAKQQEAENESKKTHQFIESLHPYLRNSEDDKMISKRLYDDYKKRIIEKESLIAKVNKVRLDINSRI